MFYDFILKKMTRPNVKMVKLVVEKRDKTYYRKIRNVETGEIEDVVIGKGFEVVKEIATTEEGEKIWKAAHPETKAEATNVEEQDTP